MFFRDLINDSWWMKGNIVVIWQLMDLEIAFHPLWFVSCLCSLQTLYQQAIKVQLKWSVLVRLKMDFFELKSKQIWCQTLCSVCTDKHSYRCMLMRESVRYWTMCMYFDMGIEKYALNHARLQTHGAYRVNHTYRHLAASFFSGWLWLSGERAHLRRFEKWSGNSANIMLL